VWRQRFPEKKNAADSLRRAEQAQRTPKWADLEKIKDVFRVATQMQRELGVRMSVDHVIPLKGEVVSGLHVHENIRVFPFVENARKSNSYKCA
jgi:high-affinity K+ transport system ATPase subunit B